MSVWGLPLGDWQFWAVTAAALLGVWLISKRLVAPKSNHGGGACSNCALGARGVQAGARGFVPGRTHQAGGD